MKRLFYDLETTGVKHWKNGIHQIAGIIEIDGEVVEEIDYRVQPNPKAIIEDKALEVGNVDLETVQGYPEMGLVYTNLVGTLMKYCDKYNKADKFHLVGYNNRSFDDQFLRAWFVQNSDKYFGSWFWSDSIDVMVLASDYFQEIRNTMPNFKLSTVARKLNINFNDESLHDALVDVHLTREIYKAIKLSQ